ncbi:MAG: c-type cytochrome [Rubricoccaceae bacterium]|nr:c-type cytochrome [Rubricoccaceae bacterium]
MKSVLKWTGRILGGLIVLLLILGVVFYFVGGSKVNKTYELPDVALTVSDDSAQVAHGAHLAATLGCTDCHTEDLSGQVMIDAPPFKVVAPNLTPAGIAAQRTDAQLEHAIRHGVSGDGTSVVIMPSLAYHGLSDGDVSALISYLRSVPAVENEPGQTQIKLMGRLLSAGPFDPAFEVNLDPSPTSNPEIGPTVEYGRYRYQTVCTYCHGENGGGMEVPPVPESPPAPGMEAAGNWTLDQFIQTMRTGVTPAGRELNAEFMPYEVFGQMSDDEMAALHAYFGTL